MFSRRCISARYLTATRHSIRPPSLQSSLLRVRYEDSCRTWYQDYIIIQVNEIEGSTIRPNTNHIVFINGTLYKWALNDLCREVNHGSIKFDLSLYGTPHNSGRCRVLLVIVVANDDYLRPRLARRR